MTELSRSEAREFLTGLPASMFQEAVEVSGVDQAHLPDAGQTPSQRAIALLQMAELSPESRAALYSWIAHRRGPRLRRKTVPREAAPRSRTADLLASRAPIVIAVEEAGRELTESELLRTERHLTVTLAPDEVAALEGIGAKLDAVASPDAVVELGLDAWEILADDGEELAGLLGNVRRVLGEAPYPQPVAWTGRLDMLLRVHRAILAACADDESVESYLTVGGGAHYFHPLSPSPRRMQRRERRTGGVRVKSLEVPNGAADTDDSVRRALADAASNEVVVLSADGLDALLAGLVETVQREPHSATRVAIGFGAPAPSAAQLEELLASLPCVSFGGPALRGTEMSAQLRRAARKAFKDQAVPVVLASLRAELLKLLREGDAAAYRDAVCWSSWSWVGRPLFSDRFGEVRKPAYPHLMDLRSVASRDWYFDRTEDIPPPYRARTLAARTVDADDRFHLYLSGAGGTGKSCFLRYVYDTLDVNHHEVLPVWYKVDAPSSDWEEVEKRIKQEVRKALERRLEAVDADMLDDKRDLRFYLKSLVNDLRASRSGIEEIVLFIDQLERTFESGDHPELHRLSRISKKFMELLDEVGVGQGIRVFIASRKQYLPDFLSSFQKARDSKLHFNVLQQISVDTEQVGFVQRVLGWCRANKLIHPRLELDEGASRELAGSVTGHPLNMMLALIQLFSQGLSGGLGKADIERHRPWEHLFYVDEKLAAKDDLDWYLFLAMAHARTEIVRFEEVWWRLRLVSNTLTGRANHLGRKGVLERLWLLGHLGRSIHPRPMGDDEAGFLEFFHANLRDHLVNNVMNYGQDDLSPAVGRRGMPPAWRALDRLREIAKDWTQSQQLLLKEDIGVLMDHREVLVERIRRDGGSTEVEAFYLLFMRDAKEHRDALLQAARECLVYSAIVHDVLGRWVFAQIFPEPASRVACCRRWIRRSDSESRLRILQYLAELRDPLADRLLAELVFDDRPEAEVVWQQFAGILCDPLVAGTHRSAFMTFAIRHLLDAGVPFPAHTWHTERFEAFLVAACGGERHAVLALLKSLAEHVATLHDARLDAAVRVLVLDEGRFERWSGPGAGMLADAALAARETHAVVPPDIELRVGEGLRQLVRERLGGWHRQVAERIGVPIPSFTLSDGEVAVFRRVPRQDDAAAPEMPRGFELQLLIRGHLVALGDFHSGRVQTLTRDWDTDGAPAAGALAGYNEALNEPVWWVEPGRLEAAAWGHRAWSVEEAVVDWMHRLLTRHVASVFTVDDVPLFLRDVAAESQGRIRVDDLFRVVSEMLYSTWVVLVNLAREHVPVGTRRVELVARLQELARQQGADDIGFLTQKLREHVSADICRTFADDTNQLSVMLLDPDVEGALGRTLKVSAGRHTFDLAPDRALTLVAAVQEHFETVSRRDHHRPVLVCEDHVRLPLSRMLHHFDPRIEVLSYTELSPEVRVGSAGVIRRVPLDPQPATAGAQPARTADE